VEDVTARRYVVGGFVQGVGFRWSTARLARSLGVRGTVRNRPDGSVEIEAVSTPETLARFREGLRADMPGRVDSIEEQPAEAPGSGEAPDDFRIVQ
jgi:acylphosphatase